MRKSIKQAAEEWASKPSNHFVDEAFGAGAWYVLNELINNLPREKQIPLSMPEMTDMLNKISFTILDLIKDDLSLEQLEELKKRKVI